MPSYFWFSLRVEWDCRYLRKAILPRKKTWSEDEQQPLVTVPEFSHIPPSPQQSHDQASIQKLGQEWEGIYGSNRKFSHFNPILFPIPYKLLVTLNFFPIQNSFCPIPWMHPASSRQIRAINAIQSYPVTSVGSILLLYQFVS